ncbi:MAG: ABC transporter ATP-binding protein [Aureispira sp.]
MVVLETQNLTKIYSKKIRAVDQLNLTIEQGNIYGILGPNGSGKTTTLGMILGIIAPTSGDYGWFGGQKGADVRRRIGAILETPNFYPYLNAQKNLELVAHIKKVPTNNILSLIERVGLAGRTDAAFHTYSLGMKQRLAIAGALIGDPEVLIFDEPTNGLDPQGIAEVRTLLSEIGAQGKTILLASHIIDEVEKICNHVAIIKYGDLIASGSVAEILSTEPIIEIGAADLLSLKSALSGLNAVTSLREEMPFLELTLTPEFNATQLNQWLFEQGQVLNHLKVRKKSLEAEFLERTS